MLRLTEASSSPYLGDEGLEEVCFVTKWVVHQAVAKGYNAMREIVLREPGHHPLLLHVWTASHVHDQVAQVLPMPVKTYPISKCKTFKTAKQFWARLPGVMLLRTLRCCGQTWQLSKDDGCDTLSVLHFAEYEQQLTESYLVKTMIHILSLPSSHPKHKLLANVIDYMAGIK